ncbi:DNA sulfur modification protein DndD [Anoxybacter fermentans]|uniref:Nuclease SbcCD subunit C n=1 Tax=Anoxybacter fermentans TaxID=1323375 RepID=A0A3S9SV63_9FIRM|nr:DNA sulfur modification protein DndD [Anoxybacter fermentans]AZR72164.1 DNA sulfur modification protein DndD [Anoxybacter fermentans]
MIIKKLEIRNFGIFYKTTTFDFNLKESDKNIILFGGKNGSGKTTILQAIKLALYGSLILGYKTNSKRYNDFLLNKFNTYALKNGEKTFAIGLNFTIKQAGLIDNYKIIRKWEIFDNKIIEQVFVEKNDKLLNEKETSDFESFIRKYIPPALFDFFFFDGEEFNKLIIQNDFEDKLKNSALTLFNLEIFEILKSDLDKYLEQENIFNELSKDEQVLKVITKKIKELSEQIKNYNDTVINLEKQVEEKQNQIKDLENEFKLYGGLLDTEIDNLKREINNLENEKKQCSEWLKSFAANILPFLICKKLLQNVQDQLTLEKQVSYYIELKNRLTQDLLENIKNNLALQQLKIVNKQDEIISPDFLIETIVKELTKSLKPNINLSTFKAIHNLSLDESTQIASLLYKINNFDSSKVQNTFDKINNNNNKIYELKQKISIALENKSLNKIWKKRIQLEKEINELTNQIEQIKLLITELEVELEKQQNEAKKLEKKISQAYKDKSAFIISKKINNILDKYIDHQLKLKIKEVETFFFQMFSSLIRKDNFIDNVKIDKDTFKVNLYSKGQLIQKNNLSAGEKQIYILSLLWALIKASNRQFPLVFDTLLGRLDHSHKTNIIRDFLPKASKQTIILSTDTEIDQKYYQLLKPHIAKEYLLEYNEQRYTIDVHNKYFL